MDRLMLKMPIFGTLVEKSVIARWTRTLSTMFAAGVPLVEALDSVGGASGNKVYANATEKIQQEVSTRDELDQCHDQRSTLSFDGPSNVCHWRRIGIH
jgi:type IV pilus assembly protein PilC